MRPCAHVPGACAFQVPRSPDAHGHALLVPAACHPTRLCRPVPADTSVPGTHAGPVDFKTDASTFDIGGLEQRPRPFLAKGKLWPVLCGGV